MLFRSSNFSTIQPAFIRLSKCCLLRPIPVITEKLGEAWGVEVGRGTNLRCVLCMYHNRQKSPCFGKVSSRTTLKTDSHSLCFKGHFCDINGVP